MENKEKKEMEIINLDTLSQEMAQLLYEKSGVYLTLKDGHVAEAWLEYDEGV